MQILLDDLLKNNREPNLTTAVRKKKNMKKRIEGESPFMHSELKEAVQNAFRRLSEKVKEGDRIFVDESGEKRFLVLKNPAGNLSMHSYETGDNYLLWENGEIEGLSTSDPDKAVDLPSSEELETVLNKIETLMPQELPEEPK